MQLYFEMRKLPCACAASDFTLRSCGGAADANPKPSPETGLQSRLTAGCFVKPVIRGGLRAARDPVLPPGCEEDRRYRRPEAVGAFARSEQEATVQRIGVICGRKVNRFKMATTARSQRP